MDQIVIGLDASTTATKALAVNSSGRIIARAGAAIPLHQPQVNYYEQDPQDWWSSAATVLQTITREINPQRIKALAISNQRETFVPLDNRGQALRPAIIWLDERCKDEVQPFASLIGADKIHRISGKPVDYAPVVYRLAWMKKYEPDLYSRISMVCDVHCWLAWKLTGSFKTSWACADPFGIFDMAKKEWSIEILRALNLHKSQLPGLIAPGSILAKISAEAAQQTGLDQDTLIIAGAGDGQAAGLGINALGPQQAYLNLGTAVVAGIFNKEYRTSKAFRTLSACADSGYYYECSLRAGTFAIDWFIKNILAINPSRQTDIYDILESEADNTTPGCDDLMFMPYICGVMNPYWDFHARGVFTGLSSAHKRGHMYRAILEGIAFEQKLALQTVEESVSITINELKAIGGGVQSSLWCKIIADITGKNITIPDNQDASAMGAAITAAMGIGWYPSFNQAAAHMACGGKTVRPDIVLHQKYLHLFQIYKKLYPAWNVV